MTLSEQPLSQFIEDLLIEAAPTQSARPVRESRPSPASGPVAQTPNEACRDCNGTGIEGPFYHEAHHPPTRTPCWTCDGTGRVPVPVDWARPMLRELGLR